MEFKAYGVAEAAIVTYVGKVNLSLFYIRLTNQYEIKLLTNQSELDF